MICTDIWAQFILIKFDQNAAAEIYGRHDKCIPLVESKWKHRLLLSIATLC